MENETATTPTTLSPAAQAVLDAFLANWADDPLAQDVLCLATALRAVVDQVVPTSDRPDPNIEFEYGQWLSQNTTRGYLLAIADELEGAN